MKKQQYLWLSLLISFILSYSSCKKKDFEEINRADSNRLSEEISKQKFFNHHDDLDSQVVNIIKDLRRQIRFSISLNILLRKMGIQFGT